MRPHRELTRATIRKPVALVLLLVGFGSGVLATVLFQLILAWLLDGFDIL